MGSDTWQLEFSTQGQKHRNFSRPQTQSGGGGNNAGGEGEWGAPQRAVQETLGQKAHHLQRQPSRRLGATVREAVGCVHLSNTSYSEISHLS